MGQAYECEFCIHFDIGRVDYDGKGDPCELNNRPRFYNPQNHKRVMWGRYGYKKKCLDYVDRDVVVQQKRAFAQREILRMAQEAGVTFDGTTPEWLERFAAVVCEAEREAVIDIIEEYRISLPVLNELKADIRARGGK